MATRYLIKKEVSNSGNIDLSDYEINAIDIPLEVGEGFTDGATIYKNTGAGSQVSFGSLADEEWTINKSIRHYNYDSEDLLFGFCGALYTTAPIGGDVVRLEVDYFLFNPLSTENPYSTKDGTLIVEIDVSSWTADEPKQYIFDLADKINSKAGATHIQLAFRRAGAHVNDTYPNSLDIYQFGLRKVE